MGQENKFLVDMGTRIANRRKELKYTQEQLAEAVNLSLQSISCIELGKKAVRPDNLMRLCLALDVSADYLLTGKRDEKMLVGLNAKLAELNDFDIALVEQIVDRLV